MLLDSAELEVNSTCKVGLANKVSGHLRGTKCRETYFVILREFIGG